MTHHTAPSWGRPLRHAGLGVLLVVLTASSVHAQSAGEESARRAFEDGVALEKRGDYAAALVKFRASAQIKSTLGNRFHAAFCLEMTGRLAAALAEYEAVDVTAREQRKAEVVEATRVRVEPLKPRVPQLVLRLLASEPGETEVELDGTTVSASLLDGKVVRVDPGEHTITAHARDRETFIRHLTMTEGASTSIDVVLPRTASAFKPALAHPRDRITEPPIEQPRPPARGPAIVATAGAVVLAAGGVVAFALGGSAKDDAERTCPTRPSCDDERSMVRALDALALGGFIGAAGLGVLSIVLWASKPRASVVASSSTIVTRGSWVGLEGRF